MASMIREMSIIITGGDALISMFTDCISKVLAFCDIEFQELLCSA